MIQTQTSQTLEDFKTWIGFSSPPLTRVASRRRSLSRAVAFPGIQSLCDSPWIGRLRSVQMSLDVTGSNMIQHDRTGMSRQSGHTGHRGSWPVHSKVLEVVLPPNSKCFQGTDRVLHKVVECLNCSLNVQSTSIIPWQFADWTGADSWMQGQCVESRG